MTSGPFGATAWKMGGGSPGCGDAAKSEFAREDDWDPRPESSVASPEVSSDPALLLASDIRLPPLARRGGVAGVVFGAGTLLGVAVFAAVASRTSGTPPVVPEAVAVAATVPTTAPQATCPPGMALVEAERFFMGTDARAPELRGSAPARQVAVASFCVDTTEVTVAAYRRCVDDGACTPAHADAWWPRGRESAWSWARARAAMSTLCNAEVPERAQHPINCVSFAQAEAFCHARGLRLPHEAEWELAARGPDGRVFPWGDELPDADRLNGCGAECREWKREHGLGGAHQTLHAGADGFVGTAPVGSFPTGGSRYGVLDAAGNVREWMADRFDRSPALGSSAGAVPRVTRGGAFDDVTTTAVDPALRTAELSEAYRHDLGFRCAGEPR